MSNTNELKTLSVNKTVVLYTPAEGDDVLTRTGIIKESSLFHAILHATSSEYGSMDENKRNQFVKKLKQSLKDVLAIDDWKYISGSVRLFKNKLHFIFLNFYRFMNEDPKAKGKSTRKVIKSLIGNKPEKLEYYNVISQLIPFSILQHKILNTHLSDDLDVTKKNILKNTVKHLENLDEMKFLDKERRSFFTKLVLEMFNTIFKEAEYSAYKLFLTNLTESNRTPSLLIHLLSLKLNRDIYILDSINRMPLNNPELIEKRRSIVLILSDNNHYEVVGKLHAGNKVQRDFSPDELFITKLQTFTCEPKQIEVQFPELIKYLPAEFKPSDKDYVDSGLDTESDSDYDCISVDDEAGEETNDELIHENTAVDKNKNDIHENTTNSICRSDLIEVTETTKNETSNEDKNNNDIGSDIDVNDDNDDEDDDKNYKDDTNNENKDDDKSDKDDKDDEDDTGDEDLENHTDDLKINDSESSDEEDDQ